MQIFRCSTPLILYSETKVSIVHCTVMWASFTTSNQFFFRHSVFEMKSTSTCHHQNICSKLKIKEGIILSPVIEKARHRKEKLQKRNNSKKSEESCWGGKNCSLDMQTYVGCTTCIAGFLVYTIKACSQKMQCYHCIFSFELLVSLTLSFTMN